VLGSTGSDPAGREGSRSLSDRLATATAATLAVIAVVAVLTAGRLALIDHASWAEVVGENEAANAVLGLTFGLLGALAVVNRPRNALSWLFVAEGQVNALAVLAARWVAYADNGRPETPLAGLAAWVGALGDRRPDLCRRRHGPRQLPRLGRASAGAGGRSDRDSDQHVP
jgi:hypothetical protein